LVQTGCRVCARLVEVRRKHTGGRTYERIAGRLPPKLAARMDLLVPETVTSGWSGAFNGQVKRQEMIEDLAAAVPFCAVVETGTYRGGTTDFVRAMTHLPVYTVEVHARYYEYCRLRFRGDPGISVREGDSREFLAQLAEDPGFPHGRVLFYLDAHWNVSGEATDEPPLRGELTTIAQYWTESVVVVDDFAVPGDPRYGFDVYGPGIELSMNFVRPEEVGSPTVFWPAASASDETGARRGCVVFAYGADVATKLSGLATLRPSQELD